MKFHDVFLIASALVLGAGCYPAYSPPARTAHYGAPAAAKAGRMEIGTSLNANAIGGGGFADLALTDDVQLDLGADFADDMFAVGFLGARYMPLNRLTRGRRVKPTLDLEAGLGVGVGGEHCWEFDDEDGGDCDDIAWDERATGGGYLGAGVGFNAAWFDLFARARMQVTGAESAPTTMWATLLVGAQATIAHHVKLYASGGEYLYENELEEGSGPFFEIGLAVLFELSPAQK